MAGGDGGDETSLSRPVVPLGGMGGFSTPPSSLLLLFGRRGREKKKAPSSSPPSPPPPESCCLHTAAWDRPQPDAPSSGRWPLPHSVIKGGAASPRAPGPLSAGALSCRIPRSAVPPATCSCRLAACLPSCGVLLPRGSVCPVSLPDLAGASRRYLAAAAGSSSYRAVDGAGREARRVAGGAPREARCRPGGFR